ncbi:retrovirus-related pol polyprotein from transposon TNT 1-94 [Tanacetum coccineum]
MTFDESPPPTKLSPLVDDDVGEEEAIKKNTKIVNTNNEEDESIEVDEIINIKESKNHPLDQVIGNLNQKTLRSQAQNHSNFFCFISTIEPKNINEALKDEVGNKIGLLSRNKARLVTQGYNQQEGIDYDETYTPVARLESIRIFLVIDCANDFKLYQMDVKSAFLNGFINEEVYVAQPPGFIDFQKPNYVYKLKKALYGLKQGPKAWYDRLKAFFIKHKYSIGMVDNTLFTKKSKSHLIIVQIYVDDIIFGSTSQNLCDDFTKIMHDEFEMCMMGELNFFLGLQIKQMEDGIFFNQSKCINEMLKKFGLEDSKPTKTPTSTEIKLTKDDEADSVDSSKYQDFVVLDMPEDIKVPLIFRRPFLSTAHAKIDVFKKITLKVGNDKIMFKSDKPTSNIIMRVYALGLRERMELDLEDRLMSKALVLNRPLDLTYGDYIEQNDLSKPLELRRNQVEDLGLTIEESLNMDAYQDKGMGDVIDGKLFCREIYVKAKRFDGMITVYNGNDSVTYQMAHSHMRFKHLTNEQCNKMRPLLKVSALDELNGISHPYQKLKSFYKGVLNLGPEYVRDAKMEESLTMGHVKIHEM